MQGSRGHLCEMPGLAERSRGATRSSPLIMSLAPNSTEPCRSLETLRPCRTFTSTPVTGSFREAPSTGGERSTRMATSLAITRSPIHHVRHPFTPADRALESWTLEMIQSDIDTATQRLQDLIPGMGR